MRWAMTLLFLVVATGSLSAEEGFYGHLPYPEASSADLVAVCLGNSTNLHKDAVQPLRVMIEMARSEGVDLRAISCFRSVRYQRWLFCRHVCDRNGKICGGSCEGRKQSEAERAKVSAPPGHSEHATGYALDFTDGERRECDLEPCFAETEAGRWLARNAPDFGFELSFPEDNAQGVSYEPWHWRFVGTEEARRIFERARTLYPASPAAP